MFEQGFLGTRALVFMDMVTVWFAVLPLLLGVAVYQAARQRYVLHRSVQIALFSVTMLMVVIFEVGVRISGGFPAYAEQSGIAFGWLAVLLAVHIVIAVAAVGMWAWLLIDSYRFFRQTREAGASHTKYGRLVFAAMAVTSLLGVLIYTLLFVI